MSRFQCYLKRAVWLAPTILQKRQTSDKDSHSVASSCQMENDDYRFFFLAGATMGLRLMSSTSFMMLAIRSIGSVGRFLVGFFMVKAYRTPCARRQ
jgi:hypothetical protein